MENKADSTILARSRWTYVYTLSSSMKMRAEKVMLTMFTKESLKKRMAKSIIVLPW